MKTKFSQFSKMEWLNEAIERNNKSAGRNIFSDYYYATLLEIKSAQENGTITDDLYKNLNYWRGEVSAEEGYYTANIHYDLFGNDEPIEEIENRMLHFLIKADKTILKNSSWFEINFLTELRYFMCQRYAISSREEDGLFFNKYGNDIEKDIFNEYKALTNRGRPIINEIVIKYYDQSKRKLELLSISFDKFGFLKTSLGKDGRVFSKKCDGRYKCIDIEKTDKYFDSIIQLIKRFNKNNNLNRKKHDEFLSILVKTYYKDESYNLIDGDMESFISSLRNIISKEFNEVYKLDFLISKEEKKHKA